MWGQDFILPPVAVAGNSGHAPGWRPLEFLRHPGKPAITPGISTEHLQIGMVRANGGDCACYERLKSVEVETAGRIHIIQLATYLAKPFMPLLFYRRHSNTSQRIALIIS
jgi:hypothetical protein